MTIDPKTNEEIKHYTDLFSQIFDYLQENREFSVENKFSKIFDLIGPIDYHLYISLKEFVGYIPEEVEQRFIKLGLIEI